MEFEQLRMLVRELALRRQTWVIHPTILNPHPLWQEGGGLNVFLASFLSDYMKLKQMFREI